MTKDIDQTSRNVRKAILKKGFIPITSYEMGHAGIGICKHEIFTKGAALATTLITCSGEYVNTIGSVGIHFGPRGGIKSFLRIKGGN